ncbi:MAG TPA: zinc metalloprotease HtpX [Thermodesulfobacteriota bacterium]|nr:zinc metalloprotease HtpX [Thermodesulfobacteriota bacterium]
MNGVKTTILLALLTGILVAIGGLLGGQQGMLVALIFAGAMNFFSYWFSDRIVLAMYGAQPVSEADAPELYSMVADLAQRAGIPMPRLYVIPQAQPNAFATGRGPSHAAVAVTEGILRILSRDELRGVLAHELGHIKNRDVLISSVAATIAGAISMIANMLQWGAMFGGLGRSDGEEGHGPAHLVWLLVTIILAPIVALIVQMAISRTREFAADATGARLSGTPLSLASALRKLEAAARQIPMTAGNAGSAHLFIVHPFAGEALLRLFSTHPSTEERIARLEAMVGRMQPSWA